MLTQAELEELMYQEGKARAAAMFARAEEAGRAGDSPYAQKIYRQFVLPLSTLLKEELAERKGPGRRKAHAVLLRGLDPDAIAFLAVRHTINSLMDPGEEQNHRRLGYSLGRTIHREMVLEQIAEKAPDLYHTLSRDFSRRMSKDERHRMTVFKMQADKAGIEVYEWGIGARDQVGLYLLDRLVAVGLVALDPVMSQVRRNTHTRPYRGVYLSPDVMSSIDGVKTYVAETTPIYGPCIEPPLNWHGPSGGGFHTERMRRVHRYLVKTPPTARAVASRGCTGLVLAAVNRLQGTAWAVNSKVLDVLTELADAGKEVAGIALPHEEDKPPRQEWMETTDKATMSAEQEAVLKAWKREMTLWYERRKRRVAAYSRFYSATRQARFFRDMPNLHFVYFLDSRGRAYPLTYGLSPQGDDLQKGLLRFSKGLPLIRDVDRKWFMIHGANSFGFDKAPLEERSHWHLHNRERILAVADDPVGNAALWAEADSPVQFLAWCLEYDALESGPGFVSHLPVALDGSCNGLQHFSAMTRDPIGGRATNLTNEETRFDIYQMVAERAMARLQKDRPEDTEYRDWWLQHGITRAVTKRSVMTTPYGVTRRSATNYVVSDYLAEKSGLPRDKWYGAAMYAMEHIWPSIGDVVVKAREAMNWLKGAASRILDQQRAEGNPDPMIVWDTPDGFLATQTYFEFQIHEIRTSLEGKVRINVAMETDMPNVSRHATALAPNFVHSMDGAHMRGIVRRAERYGISDMAMIHDSYGTHAAKTEEMFQLIRDEFVEQYECFDPLQAFYRKRPCVDPPPEMGSLNLSDTLRSEYAFS